MINNNSDKALIIFAKYPSLGNVKTRIAKSYNDEIAVGIYKILAQNIFKEANKLKSMGINVFLFYGENDNSEMIQNWVDKEFYFFPQTRGDLGAKMFNAFRTVFDKKFNRVIIVGCDIPDISSSNLIKAFKELETVDVVISPAVDGGYNYLGLNSIEYDLFKNIKWSSSEVLDKTIDKVKKNGLNYILNETLVDIDEKEELIEWINNNSKKEIAKKLKIEIGKFN